MKRPGSPTKRPSSPSKLATHLDPNPSWARSYVRGKYYDDAINIVPNSKSPKKGQVKHGAMNFFMGTGGKASSLKTNNLITIDEEGNLIYGKHYSEKWSNLDMQLGGDQSVIQNRDIR